MFSVSSSLRGRVGWKRDLGFQGWMLMRDKILPRQRILELYLRTAVGYRNVVMPVSLLSHLASSSQASQFPLAKRLKGGQYQPTESFLQYPKPDDATSDSWNLTRLVEGRLQDAPSPHDQISCTRVVCGAGSFGQVESARIGISDGHAHCGDV